MIKAILTGVTVAVLSFFVTVFASALVPNAHAQTTTISPTGTTTNSPTVPAGAPKTGFQPY